METLLGKIKDTLVAAQGSTLSYVTKIKIVAPFLPVIDLGQMPFIGIAPISSPETWVTTGKKEVIHTVEIYAVIQYKQQGYSVIGYGDKKGITDLAKDISTVLRNRRFDDYLSKPTDLEVSEYVTTPYDDNAFLLVASLKLECARLFISTEQT